MTLVGNFVRTSCSDPQASKGRRWARWPGGLVLSLGLQEGIDAYQVDGRGKTDVMQMGLRETAIGRLSQVVSANGLGERGLDASPLSILLLEGRAALLPTALLQSEGDGLRRQRQAASMAA